MVWNNLNETSHRVDWWWLNIWNWDVLKANIGNKNYTSTKVIFVDAHSEHFSTPQQLFTHLPNLNKNILKFNTKWSSIDLHTQCHLWKPNASDCTIPTSDVICISYIITKFPNTKIYLTCLDIEDRDKLFKSHSNWQHTWHANVGGLESEYLQKLMLTNKIEFINFENK